MKLLIIYILCLSIKGKFWKYIQSTHNIKSQHILLQIAYLRAGNNFKTINECKYGPIKLTFLYYMYQHFNVFVNSGQIMVF